MQCKLRARMLGQGAPPHQAGRSGLYRGAAGLQLQALRGQQASCCCQCPFHELQGASTMFAGCKRTQVEEGVIQCTGVGLVQQRLAHHVLHPGPSRLAQLLVKALVQACTGQRSPSLALSSWVGLGAPNSFTGL
jgi:hypothetical protein